VIAFHVGGGTRNDAKAIWKKLYHVCTPLIVSTDGNYSYQKIIPKYKTHII
jgi:hypothetical protein